MSDLRTIQADPAVLTPADSATDRAVKTAPTVNYPYGFGYAYQGLRHALSLLRSHQYEWAIDGLSRDVEFMERMRGGWNPEAEQ